MILAPTAPPWVRFAIFEMASHPGFVHARCRIRSCTFMCRSGSSVPLLPINHWPAFQGYQSYGWCGSEFELSSRIDVRWAVERAPRFAWPRATSIATGLSTRSRLPQLKLPAASVASACRAALSAVAAIRVRRLAACSRGQATRRSAVEQAINFLLALVLGLFGLIVTAIATIENSLRGLLTEAGISGQVQGIVLVVTAVLIILAALRLFGGIFGVLITILLILLVVHIFVPGMHVPSLGCAVTAYKGASVPSLECSNYCGSRSVVDTTRESH